MSMVAIKAENGRFLQRFSAGIATICTANWRAGPGQRRKQATLKGGSSSVAERQLPKQHFSAKSQ
jgi:hypothetical protein